MHKCDPRALSREARERLSSAPFSPFRMVLIYSLVVTVTSALYSLLSYWLNVTADGMNSLGDEVRRGQLYSLNTTLNFALSVAVMFWNFSYHIFAMRASRGEDFDTDTLKDGFRLWKRALGSRFWVAIRLLLLGALYSYLYALLLAIAPSVTVFIVLLILLSVGLLAALGNLLLSYWAVPYLAVDNLKIPTVALLPLSSRLMKGRKWEIIRIGLYYFYYYLPMALLEFGVMILSYLALFEVIRLPDALLLYGLPILQCLGLFLLNLWKRNQVSVTMACAYNQILTDVLPPEAMVPVEAPAPDSEIE